MNEPLIHPSVPNIGGIPLSFKIEEGLVRYVRAMSSDLRYLVAFTSANLHWPSWDVAEHFGGRRPAQAVVEGLIHGVRLYGLGPQVDLPLGTAVYYDAASRGLTLRAQGGLLAGYVAESTYRIAGTQGSGARAQVIEGAAGAHTPVYLRADGELVEVGDVRLVVNHHHEPREVQDSAFTGNKIYTLQPGGVQQFQCAKHIPPATIRPSWTRIKGLPSRVATVRVDVNLLRSYVHR